MEQINQAIVEMDKVTQQTAASAEESAAASEEMKAQAEQIRSAVRDLVQVINGNRIRGVEDSSKSGYESVASAITSGRLKKRKVKFPFGETGEMEPSEAALPLTVIS